MVFTKAMCELFHVLLSTSVVRLPMPAIKYPQSHHDIIRESSCVFSFFVLQVLTILSVRSQNDGRTRVSIARHPKRVDSEHHQHHHHCDNHKTANVDAKTLKIKKSFSLSISLDLQIADQPGRLPSVARVSSFSACRLCRTCPSRWVIHLPKSHHS